MIGQRLLEVSIILKKSLQATSIARKIGVCVFLLLGNKCAIFDKIHCEARFFYELFNTVFSTVKLKPFLNLVAVIYHDYTFVMQIILNINQGMISGLCKIHVD